MPTQQNRRHLDRRGVGAMTLPLAQFVQRAELEAEPRSGAGHPPADVLHPPAADVSRQPLRKY